MFFALRHCKLNLTKGRSSAGKDEQPLYDKKVHRSIWKNGKKVLNSAEFKQAQEQVHHHHTTVGVHSLHVAETSLRLHYLLQKAGLQTDEKALVIGALCHDLGMLDRDAKFANNRECCRKHPQDSAEIAEHLVGDLDPKTADIIRRHMFPATPVPPNSIEGFIVSIADKYVSVRDLVAEHL